MKIINHSPTSSSDLCREIIKEYASNIISANRVGFESATCKKGREIRKDKLLKWISECCIKYEDYDEISIHFIG